MAAAEHFFVVGAQRSGTTYLYRNLAEHPEIEMAQPLRPEPKFFLLDELHCQGIDDYEQHFFVGKPGAWLRGEKTTSYIESETAAQRIAAAFPAAKILMLVRDPIERAISNYWFSVHHGAELLPVDQAFREEEQRVSQYDTSRYSASPYAYLRRGRYLDYILAYERYFPRQQIRVMQFEQLIGSLREIQALYQYLGVAPGFIPPALHEPQNVGSNQAVPPSAETLQYMVQYFADCSRRLAERYPIDLSLWPSYLG